jgi:uncharacterized protein
LAKYDCRTCGACCGPEQDEEYYVSLVDGDAERLSKGYRRLRVVHTDEECLFKHLATKRTDHSGVVCVALQGRIGKRVRCSIYRKRPLVCRDFKRGDESCIECRKILGLPV